MRHFERLGDEPDARVLRLFDGFEGPLIMPARPQRYEHHGYGRPRTEDARPTSALQKAWLVDIGGWSKYALAKALHDGVAGDREKKRVRRDVRAGRRVLHALGALPWRGWEDGDLPKNWWAEPVFREELAGWVRDAHDRASGKPVDEPIDEETEALLGLEARLSKELVEKLFDGDPPPGFPY